MPEEPAFYPWLTPREFLEYVGRLFGLRATDCTARAKELLELVGLAEVSKRRISGFSRGMRQRLGLAQALVNRPEVLFLDEPVSALDPAGRKEVLELIERLRGQCTVFMSTHILADVERVCDAVGIVARGQLVTQAPRDELLNRYAVSIFEIETDESSAAWADSLRAFSWVASVSGAGRLTRISAADVAVAKRELLPSALRAGLTVTRFEMLKPSLEDIFLRLVGEETK